jgi:hypothetical protein
MDPGKEGVDLRQQEEADHGQALLEQPPDGGYGWVIVACVTAMNAVTWGE